MSDNDNDICCEALTKDTSFFQKDLLNKSQTCVINYEQWETFSSLLQK